MAFENPKLHMTATVAAADLSTHQFKFVTVDSNGRIAIADTVGEVVIGVLQDKPEAIDRSCSVAKAGESKVVAGAALTPGVFVTTDSSGRAIQAAIGNFVHGCVRVGTSAADELATIDLDLTYKA